MSLNTNDKSRPVYPKRAVVTNGMPYGDKLLHFGHMGGTFIQSDIYARFLRMRIGKGNVLYVCGTDCYGAGIEVKYAEAQKGGFAGSIEDFVEMNHNGQKQTLDAYGISLDIYAASGLGLSGGVHKEMSEDVFNALYDSGYLKTEEIMQFYDEETQTFLNGRQVEGRCPVQGCKSEKAYADECSLGHQFNPGDLIAPLAATTGKTPSLKAVKNWYFDLERFAGALKKRQVELREEGISRKTLLSETDNFLKEPAIHIREGDTTTVRTFGTLKEREEACADLRAQGVRFRTGTTLVPFRLSGNAKWGIPVPEKDGVIGQTFWVWPESLWAPISFVKTYLCGGAHCAFEKANDWRDWWFNGNARVYQFIGEDNIYFYAVAAMGLFMALYPDTNLPIIIPNKHVFFGSKKASSSGAVKPPMAAELLEHYTAEQLRMHFAHMALQSNSASFNPKAVTGGGGFDATLAEGNILTNVYNRIVRSCFYTMQKYFGGKLPAGEVSCETRAVTNTLINEYDMAMYKFEFSRVIDLIDVFLRDANKAWAAAKVGDGGPPLGGPPGAPPKGGAQTLIDTFHIVRVAATLLHPFAPEGTETVRQYLNIDERLWNWEYINEPLTFFTNTEHSFKFLEPRVDFFVKHEAQLK